MQKMLSKYRFQNLDQEFTWLVNCSTNQISYKQTSPTVFFLTKQTAGLYHLPLSSYSKNNQLLYIMKPIISWELYSKWHSFDCQWRRNSGAIRGNCPPNKNLSVLHWLEKNGFTLTENELCQLFDHYFLSYDDLRGEQRLYKAQMTVSRQTIGEARKFILNNYLHSSLPVGDEWIISKSVGNSSKRIPMQTFFFFVETYFNIHNKQHCSRTSKWVATD